MTFVTSESEPLLLLLLLLKASVLPLLLPLL
jgi:hypothetical protein